MQTNHKHRSNLDTSRKKVPEFLGPICGNLKFPGKKTVMEKAAREVY